MSGELNFLNFDIGTVLRIPVKSPVPLDEERRIARGWVELEDGRSLVARAGKTRYALEFPRRSDLQEVRSIIAKAPRPWVARLDLAPDLPGELRGELTILRSAMARSVEAKVRIVVDPALLPDRVDRKSIEDRLLLPNRPRSVLVVTTALLASEELGEDGALVTIHLCDRQELECRIEGAPGNEQLVVQAIKKTSALRLPAARFIGVDDVEVVAPGQAAGGTDLGAFRPHTQSLIRAWLSYQKVESIDHQQRLTARRAAPLEYGEVRPAEGDPPAFPLVLANPMVALEVWQPDARGEARSKADIPVEVRDAAGRGPSLPGELVAFRDLSATQGRVHAEVRLREGAVPPAQGIIHAAEDKGRSAQGSRRGDALQRLVSGGFANPELLDLLLAPSTVQPVEGPGVRIWQRPNGVVLNEKQTLAVAGACKLPGIFLIQGPPGTGKTQVISEIVHQLRHRVRNRKETERTGPMRLLVTSVQNDAVGNAQGRLEASGMRVHATIRESSQEVRDELASELVGNLEAQLEGSTSWRRLLGLRELDDEMSNIHEALVHARPMEAIVSTLTTLAGHPELAPSQARDLKLLLVPAETPVVGSPRPSPADGPFKERLASAGGAVSLEAIPALIAWARTLAGSLDPSESTDAGEGLVLAEEWIRLAARLELESRKGVLSTRSAVKWQELLERNRVWCAAPSPAARVDGIADHTSDPRRPLLLDWVRRTRRVLQDALGGMGNTDEAVVAEWADRLKRDPRLLRRLSERHATVMGSTCQRAGELKEDAFDVVVIDESARAGIDILIPMVRGRSIIMVGDHKQLPPYIEEAYLDLMDPAALEGADLGRESLFSWLAAQLPAANFVALDEQRRMHEDIGRMVSKVFYEPEVTLKHHYSGALAVERLPRFDLLGNQPLSWVDTSDVLGDRGARQTVCRDWPCKNENEYERLLIRKMLASLNWDQLRAVVGTGGAGVGLVTFYRAQFERVKQEVERLPPTCRDLVAAGTVDQFQGREFPLVILSTVRSHDSLGTGFLTDSRVNVAVSRAQRQLVILGDSKTLGREGAAERALGRVLAFVRAPETPGMLVPSKELL